MTHLTKVKTKLAIHAHRKVSGLLDGQYAALARGRSLDFADLREYVVGDDVKDIDWKATARHGKPLIKRYVADRKHTVMVTIATGRSMAAHATMTEVKSDVALMVAGLMGYLATRHGDYVGLYAVAADHAEALRPSTREIDVERMLVRAEEMCTVAAPEADLKTLLDFVLASTRRRNIVVLIIDDVDLTPVEEGLLKRLVVQHQVLLVTIGDLNPADPQTDGHILLELGSSRVVPVFAQDDEALSLEIASATAERQARRDRLCRRWGIAHEHVTSSDDVIRASLRLLERTRHAARR